MSILRCLTVVCVCALVLSSLFAVEKDKSTPINGPPSAAAVGYEVRMYLRHGQDWAGTLYLRSQAEFPTSKQEAQDLISGIAHDLQAADKSLANLKTLFSQDPDVVTRIEMVVQQNAKIQKLNAQLAAECAKDSGDRTVISDTASLVWHELDAALAETKSLLHALKIDKLEEPKSTLATSASDSPLPAEQPVTYGKGFRPHTAAVQQRSALDNAGVLHQYANTKGKLPESTIVEHLAEIERQLASLKTEYSKLGDELRKEKNLEQEIKALEEHQAQAQAHVDHLQKAVQAGKLNPAQLKEVSGLLYERLKAAQARHYQVMSNLGVQKPWHPRGMELSGASYDPESGW